MHQTVSSGHPTLAPIAAGSSNPIGPRPPVSWITPTNEFGTTCCILGTPGHSWQFTAQSGMSIGHKSLIFASNVMAATGLDLLTDASLLKAVRDEWKERLAGRTYEPPIPADLAPPLDQLKKD